jgi:hypothetical protein
MSTAYVEPACPQADAKSIAGTNADDMSQPRRLMVSHHCRAKPRKPAKRPPGSRKEHGATQAADGGLIFELHAKAADWSRL